jgi:hypothetical protein
MCLRHNFQSELQHTVTDPIWFLLGAKVKALIRNVEDLKRLLSTLLNESCIQFFIQFKMMRNAEKESQFSIFKHCDESTHDLISQIYEISKDRVFKLRQRDQKEKELIMKNLDDHQSKTKRFCSLEIEYGKLYGQFLAKWEWWQSQVSDRFLGLQEFEASYDLEITYEQMPKYRQIVNILDSLEHKFQNSETFKRDYEPYSIKRLKTLTSPHKSKTTKKKDTENSMEVEGKTELRAKMNQNLVILTRNNKQYLDMLKFLYHYYIKKDNGLGFYDDRLRIHINS